MSAATMMIPSQMLAKMEIQLMVLVAGFLLVDLTSDITVLDVLVWKTKIFRSTERKTLPFYIRIRMSWKD